MPVITSSYKASGLFRNCHFSTIYSAKIRSTPRLTQHRERIFLKDSDFLDLEFSYPQAASNKIAVLLHGLEGNAQRSYIKGQGKLLVENGWSVCAVNYRGCSGVPNKKYSSYNAGKTDDLDAIIQYLLEQKSNYEIALIGVSLGGNLLLKYLGERSPSPSITKAVAISTPLSLKGSLEALSRRSNWVYRTSFLFDLRRKFNQKKKRFPHKAAPYADLKIRSLLDFDNAYTAPAHGFKDAFDYYEQNSCLQFLPKISIPTLILNAENDSFLSPQCFPRQLASDSKNIYLETPKHGGHVGFYRPGNIYYNESRTLEFLTNNQ